MYSLKYTFKKSVSAAVAHTWISGAGLIRLPTVALLRHGLNLLYKKHFSFLPTNGFSSSSSLFCFQATWPPAGSVHPDDVLVPLPLLFSLPLRRSAFLHWWWGAELNTCKLLFISTPTCSVMCTSVHVWERQQIRLEQPALYHWLTRPFQTCPITFIASVMKIWG